MGTSTSIRSDELFTKLRGVATRVAHRIVIKLPQFRHYEHDIAQAAEAVLWEIIQKGWITGDEKDHVVFKRIRRRLVNRHKWWAAEKLVSTGGRLEHREPVRIPLHDDLHIFSKEQGSLVDLREAVSMYASSPESREILLAMVNGEEVKDIADAKGISLKDVRRVLRSERRNPRLSEVLRGSRSA